MNVEQLKNPGTEVRVEAKNYRSGWFEISPLSARVRLTMLGVLLCFLGGTAVAAKPHTKNVVILYSFSDTSLFGPADFLESSLRARLPWPVDFYVESFDSQRFENKEYEKSIAEALRHEYGGQKLDLVIVAAYPALQFALRHRDELFPGVPIVFFSVEFRRVAGQKMWP